MKHDSPRHATHKDRAPDEHCNRLVNLATEVGSKYFAQTATHHFNTTRLDAHKDWLDACRVRTAARAPPHAEKNDGNRPRRTADARARSYDVSNGNSKQNADTNSSRTLGMPGATATPN